MHVWNCTSKLEEWFEKLKHAALFASKVLIHYIPAIPTGSFVMCPACCAPFTEPQQSYRAAVTATPGRCLLSVTKP
jgi:hypothetical protein